MPRRRFDSAVDRKTESGRNNEPKPLSACIAPCSHPVYPWNAAIWIDRLVQGRFHFGENTWLLSYLGFASSVLLGSMAGHLLMSANTEKNKLIALTAIGAACVLAGPLWGLVFPIIKLLWTGPFVLVLYWMYRNKSFVKV